MNPLDHQLERLFRAARLGQTAPELVAPFGLETRVLAAWRSRADLHPWRTALLVRGLVLAGIIMGISFWSLATQADNPYSESLQLADSTVQLDTDK